MISENIETGYAVGFLVTLLGFACLMLPVILRFLSETDPKAASQAMADQMAESGKSRIGKLGQVLVALGTSILLLVGATWLILRIMEGQG